MIEANIGRFGPYVKFGAKYVSLKEDDPYTVSFERALEVIKAKAEADANRIILDFPDDGIQVLNGRYGPYITDKTRNARMPKDRDPKSLTLEECKALLAAAPMRPARFGKRGKNGAAVSKKPKMTSNIKAAAAEIAADAVADAAAAKAQPAATKAGGKAKTAAKAKPKAKSASKPKAKAKAKAKRSAATKGTTATESGKD